MAKTMHEERTAPSSSSSNETKKQRKKQAKREAKMMLKLEQARQDVQKAEQKLAKSQAALATNKTHLSDLEAQVQALSHPSVSAAQQQESSNQANADNHSTPATKTASKATGTNGPVKTATAKAAGKATTSKTSSKTATAKTAGKATASSTPAEGGVDVDPKKAQEPASTNAETEPEQPSLLSPAVAETPAAQEQTTPLMEENATAAGATEHATTGDGHGTPDQ
jgi:hypothetical protein